MTKHRSIPRHRCLPADAIFQSSHIYVKNGLQTGFSMSVCAFVCVGVNRVLTAAAITNGLLVAFPAVWWSYIHNQGN